MPQADIFLILTRPLDDAGIPYMVSGSVASMVYGEPRLTSAIDILRKLEYYREGKSQKHILDIRGMLEVSGDKLDMDLLRRQIQDMGLSREWKLVRETQEL